MTLRNAFEGLLTERTGRLILAASNYARDINDRMRVVVDNQVSTRLDVAYLNSSGSGTATPRLWYEASAVFTMDQREIQRQQSLINGEVARQKWTYS